MLLTMRCVVPSIKVSTRSSAPFLRCLATSSASCLSGYTFDSRQAYVQHLKTHHARLPWGFSVGTTRFNFVPQEAPHLPASMTLNLIKPNTPTSLFAAVFTKNAFPGAPVVIGRQRLEDDKLGAILVNNKISNVCANGGGVADAEEVCDALAKHLRLGQVAKVLPCSTGVIGWRIPVDSMIQNLPQLVTSLQSESVLPVAEGIMTTDLYPKIHSADVCGGRIVGIAKGAGMIEPNMATMLSYLLTDLSIPRDTLRAILREVVDDTYNALSVDTDQSTSDTVVLVSSDQIPFDLKQADTFQQSLHTVCQHLCDQIVRNGEGADHVMRVRVTGATSQDMARGVGKSVVNSPLLKCAIAGNDPNVGRLVMAIGKYIGQHYPSLDVASHVRLTMGGIPIFANGEFVLSADVEQTLVQHMKRAQLTMSTQDPKAASTRDYPPHSNCVEIGIDLGIGSAEACVLGIDLTHEYVSINADYRS